MLDRLDKKKTAITAVGVLAVAGIVGAAFAVAGPGQTAASIDGGMLSASATSSTASNPEVGSSEGFRITNNSGLILTFTDAAGSLPAPGYVGGDNSTLVPGEAWLPGQTLDFELDSGFDPPYIGDAYFEGYYPGGQDVGQLDVHLKTSGDGFSYIAGAAVEHLSTNDGVGDDGPTLQSGYDNQLLANGSTTWDVVSSIAINGSNAGSLLQSVCEAAGDQCEYNASSVVASYSTPAVLVYQYGGDSDASSNGTVSASQSWSTSQTNTYSTTVSAGSSFADALNLGVQRQSSYSFSTSQQFTTSSTADVYPGKTTEILGSYPVFESTGNLTVTLGNVTWNFADANFQFPRNVSAEAANGNILGTAIAYSTNTVDGDQNPPTAPGYGS